MMHPSFENTSIDKLLTLGSLESDMPGYRLGTHELDR